jgi:hypothetical protein
MIDETVDELQVAMSKCSLQCMQVQMSGLGTEASAKNDMPSPTLPCSLGFSFRRFRCTVDWSIPSFLDPLAESPKSRPHSRAAKGFTGGTSNPGSPLVFVMIVISREQLRIRKGPRLLSDVH